jgi:hypothetical protein
MRLDRSRQYWQKRVDRILFDGLVLAGEELLVSLGAVPEDGDYTSDDILRFRHVFAGDSLKWSGPIKGGSSPGEDLTHPWQVEIAVEVSRRISRFKPQDRGEHVDHHRLNEEWERGNWGPPPKTGVLLRELMASAELPRNLTQIPRPEEKLIEAGADGPLIATARAHRPLEVIDNPSPEGSFGYASATFAVAGRPLKGDADIVIPFKVTEAIDRQTIRLFEWDERSDRWRMIPRSAVHPKRDVVWGRTTRRGPFVAIGMPRDPGLRRTICALAEYRWLIRDARAAGLENFHERICQFILCPPDVWRAAVVGEIDGSIDFARLPDDVERARQEREILLADTPPMRPLGETLPADPNAPPGIRHGGSNSHLDDPPQDNPEHGPGGFRVGGGGNICEICLGLDRPDLLPEIELCRPELSTPWEILEPPWNWNYDPCTYWESLGPSFPTCVIRDLATHPDYPTTLFVAAQAGGVWRTTNDGATWKPLTDHLPNLNAYAITVARRKAPGALYRSVYFGTKKSPLGDDFDFYASEDNGHTWERRAAVPSDEAWEIVTGKDRAGLVYLAGNQGLHRSDDGGRSWVIQNVILDGATKVNSRSTFDGMVWDVKLDPTDDDVIWIAVKNQGVLVSGDGGASWVTTTTGVPELSGGGRILLGIGQDTSPGGHGTDFVVAKTGETIAYTTTGGTSWRVMPAGEHGGGTQNGWCSALAVSPSSEDFIVAGGYHVAQTSNATTVPPTWVQVPGLYWTPWNAPVRTDEYHPDIQIIRFDPHDHNRYYVGNDGGITLISGSGEAALRISDGLNANILFYMDISQTGTFHLGASSYHVGIIRKRPTGTVWEYVEDAEGGLYRIDPRDHTLHFCAPWGKGLRRSISSGDQGSWTPPPLDVGGAGDPYCHQLEFRPSGSKVIWAGTFYDRLHFSTNDGQSWTPLQDAAGNHLLLDGAGGRDDGVACIAFAPSNADVTYVGTGGGRIWKTITGSQTSAGWTQVGSLPRPPADGRIGAIAVHPSDPDVLYAGYALTGETQLYRSANGGNDWEDFTGATPLLRLPQLPVVDIVIDPDNPLRIFVALEYGVYFTEDGGDWWRTYSDRLPLVGLAEMRHRKATGTLYIATKGRGVFSRRI